MGLFYNAFTHLVPIRPFVLFSTVPSVLLLNHCLFSSFPPCDCSYLYFCSIQPPQCIQHLWSCLLKVFVLFFQQNQIYNSIHYQAELGSFKNKLTIFKQLLPTLLCLRELVSRNSIARSLHRLCHSIIIKTQNVGQFMEELHSLIKIPSLVMRSANQTVTRDEKNLLLCDVSIYKAAKTEPKYAINCM